MLRGRPEAVQPGQNPGRWSPSWDSPAQSECATLRGCRCSGRRRVPRWPREDEAVGFVNSRTEADHFGFYFGLVWVEVSFLGGGTLALETNRRQNISRYSKFTAYENKAPSPKANHSR